MGVRASWSRVREAAVVVKTAGAVVADRNLTFVAGAIAYAAFLSLVPVLVLLVGVAALVKGGGVVAPVLSLVATRVSPTAAALLRGALSRRAGTLGASAIGLVVLVWSALRVFRGLNVAFGAVYGQTTGSFVDTLRDGVASFASIVAAVLFLVAVETALLVAVERAVLELFAPVLLFVGLTVAFLPVYYVLPDVEVSVREVLPGALFAAAGWLALGASFRVYVAVTGVAAGVLGGVILLLTWLYVAAVVVLLGAVVNAVLGGRESRGPTPDLAAVDDA